MVSVLPFPAKGVRLGFASLGLFCAVLVFVLVALSLMFCGSFILISVYLALWVEVVFWFLLVYDVLRGRGVRSILLASENREKCTW